MKARIEFTLDELRRMRGHLPDGCRIGRFPMPPDIIALREKLDNIIIALRAREGGKYIEL